MLVSLATLALAAGTLVLLGCNVFVTRLFLAPAPRGERGVGLLVPLAALAVAAALVTLGGLLGSFRAGRPLADLLPSPAPLAGAITVTVSFGVALAAVLAFAFWAEPVAIGPGGRIARCVVGWTAGLVGPGLLAAVLLVDLWMRPDALRSDAAATFLVRAGLWALPPLALLGYGAAAWTAVPSLRFHVSTARAAGAAERAGRAALRRRLRSASLVDLFRDELDRLPADAPFMAYASSLTGSPVALDEACVALLAERALGRTDWRGDLPRALRGRACDERWSALEFVRRLPHGTLFRFEAELGPAIEESILATARDLALRPAWLTEPYDRNLDPLGLIRSLLGAAKRFEGRDAEGRIRSALRALARDAATLRRDASWRRLAKELAAAGHPIPSSNEDADAVEATR